MPRYCGAKAKHGGRCRSVVLPGKRRCRLHGGRLTGGWRGHAPSPRARIATNAKVAFLHALGLRWYGGRPRKHATVLRLQDQARIAIMVGKAELEAKAAAEGYDIALPVVQAAGEIALTPAQQLSKVAYLGLTRLEEIVSRPIVWEEPGEGGGDLTLKEKRLIGDMSIAAIKLFARAAEGELRARKADAVDKLLEMLANEQKQLEAK